MSTFPADTPSLASRLAGGPISWGVCEVPGWGAQLPPERVLREMRELGLRAAEAGPEGYLGNDAAAVRALLDANGLALVGGFLPLVLHDPGQLGDVLARAEETAALFGALGASVLCSAAIVDESWAPRRELADAEWEHLFAALARVDEIAAARGLVHVLHPHWGTLVEQDEDVARVLDGSSVRLCLDTGHLTLGGADPLELARRHAARVAHVHLKDVDAAVATRLRAGEVDLVTAVQHGLFQPLGLGDVRVEQVIAELERAGYDGWYVLEQDTALTAGLPPAGYGPQDDVRLSVEFLQAIARRGVAATTPEGR